MKVKICGIKDKFTLKYIINHRYPPEYIGFISNYPKSTRNLEYHKLGNLINLNKKKSFFVSVLVNPKTNSLERIKNYNFDYFQLYDVSPIRTKFIKDKYKIKIITALRIKTINDVMNYKKYENISDIIMFDGKGYEKSVSFDHNLISKVPKHITKMLAGNIKYYDKLDKFSEITDIVDISGSLETHGEKDIKKIDILLKNAKQK